MAVRFLEPVDRNEGARVRRFVDEALKALDADLDIPVIIIDRHGQDGPTDPRTAAWANKQKGIFVCRDQLDFDDEDLRETVLEEIAHFWFMKAYPAAPANILCGEAFAIWFVIRTCGSVALPTPLDPTDRYALGRYVGAALAGATVYASGRKAREALPDNLRLMVDRLDGDREPVELAAQLVAELGR